MRRLLASRIVPVIVVVAALAGVYGLAMAGHPVPLAAASAVAPPRSTPVTAVERGCPGLALPGESRGRVALAAAPRAAGGTGSGRAVATVLGAASGDTPLLAVTRPGKLSLGSVQAGGHVPAAPRPGSGRAVGSVRVRGGVVVRATGAMARGLAVEQTAGTGVPDAPCASPGTSFWFVGPGQRGARQIRLYLMNPAGEAADVSVEIATDGGPLQGSTDAGIAVAPHSMVMQSLAPLVGGSRVVSLHVRTSVGQVVAAVRESTGATGGGGAWLPASQEPATRVIVPGLPDASGSRRLFLAVPGQRDAHITIAAVTSRGTYQPTGGSGVDVPGGSAVAIDLPSMAGIPAALKLVSSEPITASVMVPGGPAHSPGVFTAAAPSLLQQGVAAANVAGGSGSSALVLSAPRGQAAVKVSDLAGGGARKVTVKAGRSKLIQLSAARGAHHQASFAVLIVPLSGSGPVYAGRVVLAPGSGTVRSLMPVESALSGVPLPAVRAVPITAWP